jgi:hypothetical protein
VSGVPDEPVLAEPVPLGAVVRRAAPRLLRDGFGPLVAFYLGWKLVALGLGIGLAGLLGVSVFVYERRRSQPAVLIRVALVLVAIRATVGLSSGSATAYLAQEIGIDTLLGCLVLLSLRSARPFASWFTDEIYPLPVQVRESAPFTGAMRKITAVWGAYFLVRALVRLTALLTLTTDGYVLVAALSDAPFLIGLLAWSVYHTAGVLRSSPQWGPMIAAAEAAAGAKGGPRLTRA